MALLSLSLRSPRPSCHPPEKWKRNTCEPGNRSGTGRVLLSRLGGGGGMDIQSNLLALSGRNRRLVLVRRSSSTEGHNSGEGRASSLALTQVAHLGVSLGIFLGLDKLLKKLFVSASIKFPSALFGMFCIFVILNVLDAASPDSAASVVSFFSPAITFIQRWLPLFYVPSLVVIPLATKGIPASAGAKIGAILVFGWAATLAVAGYTAVAVRGIVRTKLEPTEPTPKPAPFTAKEITTWSIVFVLSFGLAVLSPGALGSFPATALPFLLAATVLGYMLGSSFPADLKKVLHPIVCCAIAADLAAFLLGLFTQRGFESILGAYLTKNPRDPGAGDLLMGFLGSVILSFSFSMFRQRKLVKRHAAEIFSAVIASSLFSLYSTAAAGRVLGLDGQFTRAIVPRCVTVALALPISSLLEAQNQSLTAAVVVLTGLVGANFAQTLMDKLELDDPIARGMATASSAHGLGTAALSAKEPEALPFCAIAYALTGIISSVVAAVPVVQQSLVALAG
ncbi:plastidal glycolate/glycerate translocator 1, chloroplastic isoform X1 [Selaginella moellendorffii]|nr:plastidal glycolate/glycerate translocator 1, chloroplastic isoform X1 [Selaginella moellendorffii]|eukprot:XP_002982386.2 plastidal glycolate/glycerate translocator 1, chloroplastic isoform X1 [Selaginella moellendorffii]